MAIKIETPPALRGDADQQIAQIYSFLFRLSENLNVALSGLDGIGGTQVSAALQNHALSASQMVPESPVDMDISYNELRALIVNTASIVRSEMDFMKVELEKQYNALSGDWGTFQENISSTIEATAESVVNKYDYGSSIKTLQEAAAGFSAYQTRTEGYIRQGFIDYDENNIPIVGIAIGQGLTSKTITVDGTEYEQIDNTQSCAFYTANKVSFRINGQEVAYVSNRKLYIHDVEITGTIIIGGEWMISTPPSRFTIRNLRS